MALTLPKQIALSGRSFVASNRDLLSPESVSPSKADFCRVRFTSSWKASAAFTVPKSTKECDFPSLSLSSPPTLCTPAPSEDRWRRSSPTQGSQPSAFPCNAFETQMTFPPMPWNDWSLDESLSASWAPLKEHTLSDTRSTSGRSGGVPVYVMLPLDSITFKSTVNRKRAMNASLLALKSAGVEGVMLDVWWGIVEKDEPGKYNWAGYKELIDMVKKHGLKVQAVMSFHQCGGNVGDSCFIPLPKWVVEEMDRNPDLAYSDKYRSRNYEYLSLGCDTLPVLKGRAPVQAYADYMRSFRESFEDLLGETIVEVQVGMGPAGELRYPSYPEANGKWRFPGVGEFQCYDKYMLAGLKAAAERIMKPQWSDGGPSDAAHYNNWPEDSNFFRRDGGWNSSYGQFFLEWYSNMLLAHGERILASAEGIFRGFGVRISGKVAGIHWHYGTRSHAAELTAGYYNTRKRDGYLPIARMFGRHGVVLNFTCIEMKDSEQPATALCLPEKLLRQVVLAAREASVPVAGENALPRFDEGAHQQVIRNSRLTFHDDPHGALYEPMCAFTFLRMNQALFQSDNWRNFVMFVRQMSEGKIAFTRWEEHQRVTDSFVHATRPLVQEAAAALAH